MNQNSILAKLQYAIKFSEGKTSHFIQEYKDKNLKKQLTYSDVNKVANFASNKMQLR